MANFVRPFEWVHRGAFCQFPFRWIYYCHSSKSTGKETDKMHLCGVGCQRCHFWPSWLYFAFPLHFSFIAHRRPLKIGSNPTQMTNPSKSISLHSDQIKKNRENIIFVFRETIRPKPKKKAQACIMSVRKTVWFNYLWVSFYYSMMRE